jgi:hypothetical protein
MSLLTLVIRSQHSNVILSEAKNLAFGPDDSEILRFAQNDNHPANPRYHNRARCVSDPPRLVIALLFSGKVNLQVCICTRSAPGVFTGG